VREKVASSPEGVSKKGKGGSKKNQHPDESRKKDNGLFARKGGKKCGPSFMGGERGPIETPKEQHSEEKKKKDLRKEKIGIPPLGRKAREIEKGKRDVTTEEGKQPGSSREEKKDYFIF